MISKVEEEKFCGSRHACDREQRIQSTADVPKRLDPNQGVNEWVNYYSVLNPRVANCNLSRMRMRYRRRHRMHCFAQGWSLTRMRSRLNVKDVQQLSPKSVC